VVIDLATDTPFTGFGYATNSSVKFSILAPRNRMPDWVGGPRLNQFSVRGSSRIITQRDGHDPYLLTLRLELDDMDALERFSAFQGQRASLWYAWGLTKVLDGEKDTVAGAEYLRLDDVLLLPPINDIDMEVIGGVVECTATFQKQEQGGTYYGISYYTTTEEDE
jgi:hypothetical protein